MTAADFLQMVEAAAALCNFYRGEPPQTIYINPQVLLKLSNTGLWELPQVTEVQIASTYRVLRRMKLATGIIDVREDTEELLFRFE